MKYYIIVASKDHVEKGKKEGFAQAGHSKKTQLEKLKKGDWVIYHLSKDKYINGKAFQKFTAIGEIMDEVPFQISINQDFKPWRRIVNFHPEKEIDIKPLLDNLAFINNRRKWGLHLMSGFVEIGKVDFELIAKKMLPDETIHY